MSKRFRDRKDGSMVRISGFDKFLYLLKPRRSEAEVYISKKIDVSDLVKYMEVYRKKNLEYLDKVNDAIEYYRIRMNEIDKDDMLETLKIDVYLKALNAKRDSFVLTDQLLRNYIYLIYSVNI